MSRTIIVGAGINGLLLGALLANDGDEVTVLEKNAFPGGRAFLSERGGFMLDNGIHLTRFGPESALAKIMKKIGEAPEFRKLGASYVIDQNGKMTVFPTSPGSILKSEMFTLFEKLKLLSVLIKVRKGAFNNGLMDVSLRDWMNMNDITGGIRRYLELMSASLMVCPFIEKTSSGEMFRILHRVLNTGRSAEYLAGGWKPVYASLAAAIEKSGAIRYGVKVDSVILDKRRAVGVKAGNKKYPADRVVINLPVQELFGVLPAGQFDKGYVKMCKGLAPTSGIFFDIALKKRMAEYDGLLYTYNPMAFGMITSNLEDGLAPGDGQLLTMFYPTTEEDIRDSGLRMKRKEELWRAIKKFFPSIDNQIEWTRVSCLKMVDGVQVNTNQTEDKRPGPVVPGALNLFLVGDTIAAPGAGGDVGNESVLATFREMTGKIL